MLFKKEPCALEAVSSLLSHPRLSLSPNYACPGLRVFSHGRWSWSFHHAAHSHVVIQFGNAPVSVQSHVGNALGPGVFPGRNSRLVYRSGTLLWCRLQRNQDLFITREKDLCKYTASSLLSWCLDQDFHQNQGLQKRSHQKQTVQASGKQREGKPGLLPRKEPCRSSVSLSSWMALSEPAMTVLRRSGEVRAGNAAAFLEGREEGESRCRL